MPKGGGDAGLLHDDFCHLCGNHTSQPDKEEETVRAHFVSRGQPEDWPTCHDCPVDLITRLRWPTVPKRADQGRA